MTRAAYGLDRRSTLRAAAGFTVAGPLLVPLARRPRAQALDKVSFHTDWRAQAEHGGYYQAIAAGLYRQAGIECDLRQGGPSLNISQLLLAGRFRISSRRSIVRRSANGMRELGRTVARTRAQSTAAGN